jgi:hypothetical protein
MKYIVEMQPEFSGFDKKTGVYFIDFYCLEETTSNEYCGTMTATDVKDDKIVDFTITFKDWQSERVVTQSYNKQLFDELQHTAALMFKRLMRKPKLSIA